MSTKKPPIKTNVQNDKEFLLKLKVFTSKNCFCDVGIPTGKRDKNGAALCSGDVVMLLALDKVLGTSLFLPDTGILSIMVGHQYQSYQGGKIDLINEEPVFFPMGIQGQGFNDGSWYVFLFKRFSDMKDGDQLSSYWLEYAFTTPKGKE